MIYRIYINDKKEHKSYIYSKEYQNFCTPSNWGSEEFKMNSREFEEAMMFLKSDYKGFTIQIRIWDNNYKIIKEYDTKL